MNDPAAYTAVASHSEDESTSVSPTSATLSRPLIERPIAALRMSISR